MKFVSRSSNYRVVLRHGQSAEPLTGRAAVPGIHIKFENGMVNIDSDMGDFTKEEVCKMMLKHPAYQKGDFILADGEIDPYADNRDLVEPVHNIMELEHGSVSKNINPKPKLVLTNEHKKLLKEMATQIAKEMIEKLTLEKDVIDKGSTINKTKKKKKEKQKIETEEESEIIEDVKETTND